MSLDALRGMDNDEFFRLLRKFSMCCAACWHGGQSVTETKFDGHSAYYCTDLNFCLAMRRRNERQKSQRDVQVEIVRDGGWLQALNVRCRVTNDGDLEVFAATANRSHFDLDQLSDDEWFCLEQAICKKAQECREADEG